MSSDLISWALAEKHRRAAEDAEIAINPHLRSAIMRARDWRARGRRWVPDAAPQPLAHGEARHVIREALEYVGAKP